jgi:hypothetical protein
LITVRPVADLHPPPAARGRGGQPVRDAGQAEAELAGQGGGGQGVRHMMRAVQPHGDRGGAFGGQQRETRAAQVIQPDVGGHDGRLWLA